MTTAPLVLDFEVGCEPETRFDVWTARFGDWWPRGHSVSGDPVDIVLEPRVGGRIYERLDDGREIEWGEVTAWEPSGRHGDFHISPDPPPSDVRVPPPPPFSFFFFFFFFFFSE